MKTQSLFLTGMILVAGAFVQTQAQAQTYVRRGGNHDGGGQTVQLANGDVSIADRFQPAGGTEQFLPVNQEPVDIFAEFPGLTEEVTKLGWILDAYMGTPNRHPKSEQSYLMRRLVHRTSKFFLVSKLPDVKDCEIPRDNSAVPADAKVEHAACTLGQVTLLLDSGPTAFSQLALKVKADLLAHEAFRRREVLLPTGSIEIIMAGLTQARDILDRQTAGNRAEITDQEMATLNAMSDEFPRTDLNGWRGRMVISRSGGGLVSPESALALGAFVGIGSVVESNFLIGQNTQIIRSIVESHNTAGFTHSVGSNSTIVESQVSGTLVQVLPGSRIENSDIYTSLFNADWDVVIKNSHLYGGGFHINSRAQILDSSISVSSFREYNGVDIDIGNAFVISSSQLTSENIDSTQIAKDAPPTVKLAAAGELANSKITFTKSFYQGANSSIKNLVLRVRPLVLEEGENPATKVPTEITVEAGSQVVGGGKPIVLLAQSSMIYDSKLNIGGSLTLGGRAQKCPMGLDSTTGIEFGVKFNQLDLRSEDQLTECAQTAPLLSLVCDGIECVGVNFAGLPKLSK